MWSSKSRVRAAAGDENELAWAGAGIGVGETRLEFEGAEGAAQAVGGVAADLLDEFGGGLAGVAADFGGS